MFYFHKELSCHHDTANTLDAGINSKIRHVVYTNSRVWYLRQFLVKIFENKYHCEKIRNLHFTYILQWPKCFIYIYDIPGLFQEARNYFKQNNFVRSLIVSNSSNFEQGHSSLKKCVFLSMLKYSRHNSKCLKNLLPHTNIFFFKSIKLLT